MIGPNFFATSGSFINGIFVNNLHITSICSNAIDKIRDRCMFASQISFLAWVGGRINTSKENKEGIKYIVDWPGSTS